MANLTRQDKKKICSPWIRKAFVESRKVANLDFDDLGAAAQAVEDWVIANQASFVSALPQPFRAKTNATEKSLMLIHVVMKRVGLI